MTMVYIIRVGRWRKLWRAAQPGKPWEDARDNVLGTNLAKPK